MESTHSLRDKINEEGPVLGTGIPLLLFPSDYVIPKISVHEAVMMGMGKTWRFKDIIIPTVRDHIQNSVEIEETMKKYKITEDECGAIVYYSCDSRTLGGTRDESPFRKLNFSLTKREMIEIENWKPFVYFLLSGLEKLPNTKGKVYRALDQPISSLSKQYQKGKNVVWVSFTSTSSDRKAVDSFIDTNNKKGTFMLLNITEGKDISLFSLFPNEKELLLIPNSTFVVVDVISTEMKDLMNLPSTMDGIILTQKSTAPHLLLMKTNINSSEGVQNKLKEEQMQLEQKIRELEQKRHEEEQKIRELEQKRREEEQRQIEQKRREEEQQRNISELPPLQNQLYPLSSNNFLRFDGVYKAKENYISLIRFYEDGTVLNITTVGNVATDQILRWFHKGNYQTLSRGKYIQNAEKVAWDSKCSAGVVSYDAILNKNSMKVKSHSHINNNKAERDFIFESVTISKEQEWPDGKKPTNKK